MGFMIRNWINLVEDRGNIVRVYHGSPDPDMKLLPSPLYGVRDFGFAASYGLGRGQHAAFVYTLDFRFDHLADERQLLAVCAKFKVEPSPSVAGVFIGNPEMLGRLTRLGYDGITAYDFGFRSDFEELPVWMVFNAATQVRIINVVEVSNDDLKSTHPPLA